MSAPALGCGRLMDCLNEDGTRSPPRLVALMPGPTYISLASGYFRQRHPIPQDHTHSPDLDPVVLQLVIPIQHQHVHRRLATPVPDRLERLLLLRPSLRPLGRREVFLRCRGLVGESRDEDEPRIARRRGQEEGGECVGEHVRAGDVDVVGFGEGLAERDPGVDVLEVEGRAGVVDEHVDLAGRRLDLFICGLDARVAVEIDGKG